MCLGFTKADRWSAPWLCAEGLSSAWQTSIQLDSELGCKGADISRGTFYAAIIASRSDHLRGRKIVINDDIVGLQRRFELRAQVFLKTVAMQLVHMLRCNPPIGPQAGNEGQRFQCPVRHRCSEHRLPFGYGSGAVR
jgi:hypothetical protein